MLLMEVTPVIMLQTMRGSTIILSKLRKRSPNSAMRLMTCSARVRACSMVEERRSCTACLLGLNVFITAPAANPNTTPKMV